jgi:hypothetical protein
MVKFHFLEPPKIESEMDMQILPLNCNNFTWNDPTKIKLALLGLTYHCLYHFIQLLTLFLKPFWINLGIVFSSTIDPEYKNSIYLWSLILNSDYTLFTPLPYFISK